MRLPIMVRYSNATLLALVPGTVKGLAVPLQPAKATPLAGSRAGLPPMAGRPTRATSRSAVTIRATPTDSKSSPPLGHLHDCLPGAVKLAPARWSRIRPAASWSGRGDGAGRLLPA